MIRTLVVALTALSLALPAVAAARTDPPYDPGIAAQTRSGQAEPSAPSVVVSTGESGFNWGDAAIGAGVTLALFASRGRRPPRPTGEAPPSRG